MPRIEELEMSLPNGLHDSRLRELRVDFASRELTIAFDVLISENRVAEYRKGMLRIAGFHFIAVDPPGANADLDNTRLSRVSSGPGHPSTCLVPSPSVPSGHFLHWFFVDEWNSFIRIVAKDAEFGWIDLLNESSQERPR